MSDMVRVRSAKEYFEEYGREAIYKQKADKKLVRSQLIDAFHKEIFGLVAMRTKKRFDEIPPEGDPEALRIAHNVIKDTTRKWKKLVDMFEKYRETSGVIKYDDISMVPEDGEGIGFNDEGLVVRKGPEEAEAAQDTDEIVTSGYISSDVESDLAIETQP